MSDISLLDDLIDALTCLPGVGPKSAQRMAFHLLQRDRASANRLGATLQTAMRDIKHCQTCRNFTEQIQCAFCADSSRDASQLCVVESPADVLAVERATNFRGRYFVLMGHLSPLDGIGPADLGLPILEEQLSQSTSESLPWQPTPL